jgi:hypothetical protein
MRPKPEWLDIPVHYIYLRRSNPHAGVRVGRGDIPIGPFRSSERKVARGGSTGRK